MHARGFPLAAYPMSTKEARSWLETVPRWRRWEHFAGAGGARRRRSSSRIEEVLQEGGLRSVRGGAIHAVRHRPVDDAWALGRCGDKPARVAILEALSRSGDGVQEVVLVRS